MEKISDQPALCELYEFRVRRWRRFLEGVVTIEDLFPKNDEPDPDIGVRQPLPPDRPLCYGAIALVAATERAA